MQITINHQEINEALYEYCVTRVQIPEGQKLVVNLVSGRGDNGNRATLDFEAIGEDGIVPSTPPVEPAKKAVKTPVTPKEKPVIAEVKADPAKDNVVKTVPAFNVGKKEEPEIIEEAINEDVPAFADALFKGKVKDKEDIEGPDLLKM